MILSKVDVYVTKMLKDSSMEIKMSSGDTLVAPYMVVSHQGGDLYATTTRLRRTRGVYNIPTVGIINIDDESDDDFENETMLSSEIISN